MTFLEIILLILLVIVVVFAIYYFFKGSRGHISLSRPVESRIDDYLDQRFERLIAEWELVQSGKAVQFTRDNEPALARSEAKAASLGSFEKEITATLDNLEVRLAAMEKELEPAKK
ncbi:MAG: hypothetical protein LUQ31_08490 [Methanoregula sp.]|jgi:hypothetical protein|nr:hypothetical protein [Methanoregula sp.]